MFKDAQGCEHLMASLPIDKNTGEAVDTDPPKDVTPLIWPPGRPAKQWAQQPSSAMGTSVGKRLMDMTHFVPTLPADGTCFSLGCADEWIKSLTDVDHEAWKAIQADTTQGQTNDEYDKYRDAAVLTARTIRCDWLKTKLRIYGQTDANPADLNWMSPFRPHSMPPAAIQGESWKNHLNHGGMAWRDCPLNRSQLRVRYDPTLLW